MSAGRIAAGIYVNNSFNFGEMTNFPDKEINDPRMKIVPMVRAITLMKKYSD